MDSLNCSVIACMIATLPLHSLPPVSLHYTAVGEPANVTVTLREGSIFLEWSPPSEGSPLSYTVTWTGSGVTSSHFLPPTAHNYTIRGLDSNTAYSGALKVCENTANVTAPWDRTPYHKVSCIQVVMVFQNTGVLWQTFIIHTMHQSCMQKHGTNDK